MLESNIVITQEEFSEENMVQIIKRFRLVTLITIAYLTAGTIFYHFVEDLRWIDSIYFCVVSLLTVGYGDFTPQTDTGKLFTIFYLIWGVGILAAFASILLKRVVFVYFANQKEE